MRKFLFIIAMMLVSTGLFAQTVESSKLFDNTYIGVYGGGTTTNLMTTHRTFFWNGAKDIVKGVRPVAAVEFGKYVTPVVGFSVEGQAIFNTTKSSTFVDQSNVIANAKVNLSNLIGGYPGQPRFVEVVAVPGIGWGHNYGHDYDIPHFDKNYLTYKAGAEVNFNVADNWQINVRPSAIWWNYNNMLKFHSKNLQAQVLVGATYKFGNFKNCPYTVTAAEYNALQNKVKELQDALDKKPTEVVKEVPVEKVIEKVIEKGASQYFVQFAKGKYDLDDAAKTELDKIQEGTEVAVIATSSPEGKKLYNKVLSQKRADEVKAYLEGRKVKVVSAEGLGVTGPTSNRVAIVKVN
jgi:outer membrane protein OmpA-like peptidoglycan-associated protein